MDGWIDGTSYGLWFVVWGGWGVRRDGGKGEGEGEGGREMREKRWGYDNSR